MKKKLLEIMVKALTKQKQNIKFDENRGNKKNINQRKMRR